MERHTAKDGRNLDPELPSKRAKNETTPERPANAATKAKHPPAAEPMATEARLDTTVRETT